MEKGVLKKLVCNFSKKSVSNKVFSCEFREFFEKIFLAKHLRMTAPEFFIGFFSRH